MHGIMYCKGKTTKFQYQCQSGTIVAMAVCMPNVCLNTFTHFVLLHITMYHFVMTLYVGSERAAIILVYMHMDKLAEPSDKCVPVGLLASELQDTSFGSTM